MKRLVVIFFLLLCVLPLSSQIFEERRIIKMTALELFESYQDVYNRLYQSNKNVYIYDQFINLFSDSAKLFNDLLFDYPPAKSIDSFEYYMSPAKYFEIVEKETKENSLKGEFKDYSDLRLDSISKNKKYCIINLSFKRRVEFSMYGDTLYPYKGYEPLYYTIKIKMSNNLKKGGNRFKDAKIISVSVLNPIEVPLRFLEPSPSFNYGDTVRPTRGMPIGYLPPDIDLDKEAQRRDPYSSIFNNPTLVCRYDLKKDRGENVFPQDKHFYVTSYKKSDFAGVGIDVCPYGFGNKISDANKKSGYDNISQNNFTMGVSIFYGLNILSKNRYSLFFVPQLNLNYRRFDYKGTYKTQYQSVDADGALYIRNINIELNKETVNQFLINIPVVVSNMFLLHKDDDAHQLFFSLDCGIQFSCSPITRNRYDFLADYTGLYDFFGGVEFDHYYDYGNFNLTQNDIHYIPNSLINKFNLGVLVGVGVLYQIHENSLIKFSLSYRNEFLSVAKYKEGFVLSKDFSSFESLIQASKLGAHNLYFSLSFVRAFDRNSED